MGRLFKLFRYSLLLLFSSIIFFSCKTVEKVSVEKIRPMATGRLIKRVEQNAFNSKNLSIKRINCLYEDNTNKASFKASLKAIRDKQIVVSISKLNIPVGRVLMTPDSLVYVNFVDKNFFVDDYSYLSNMMNIDLDFETVQAIISNSVFSYHDDPKDRDFKNFTTTIEDGMYVVKSIKNRKLRKYTRKGKTKKVERILKRLDDQEFIVQSVYIEPSRFNLAKMRIEDKTNNRLMEMVFDDYTNVGKNDYPGLINVSFNSPESNMNMRIRLSGFSTRRVKKMKFNIPQRYDRIDVY